MKPLLSKDPRDSSLMDCVMPLSLCFNHNVFQGFSSLQYDMSGGSVKISSLVVVDSVGGAISSLGKRRVVLCYKRAIFFYVHFCSFV